MRRGQKDPPGFMPFYAPPSKYKTSAEIIREARAHIHIGTPEMSSGNGGGGCGAPRPLPTQRPFTPRDRQRTLFGKAGKPSRPPSAVSLNYLQYQSTDSLVSTPPTVKRVQLSPMPSAMSSSLDEGAFKRLLLENIEEKPELGAARKKRGDATRRSRSLQMDTDQDSEGKFKLPCLNGLSKPLHQRKSPGQIKSLFGLQSLSEEYEDSIMSQTSYVPSSSLSKSMENKSSDGSRERFESSEPLPGLTNTISLDIFNKRRLFSNFKSKSEDQSVNVSIKLDDETASRSSADSLKMEVDYRKLSEYETRDKTWDNASTENTLTKSTPTKIAFQIPSSDPNIASLSKNSKSSSTNTSVHRMEENVKESKVILDKLSHGSLQEFTEEDIIADLKNLYTALDRESSWHTIVRDEKAFILKTLYKYVESTNEKLLMAIARIVLSLRVTGSNLSGICKLIFKVARNDKNDHLFFIDNTLELFMIGLGSAEPLNDAECLVYGYGALKFLGMSPSLLEKMKPIGALPLMTLHLKMFNQARSEDPGAVAEQGCHALYQLTGALRNMAGHCDAPVPTQTPPADNAEADSRALRDFIDSGAMTELCKTIRLFPEDLDVETNVSRTLSVLSADYECCVSLCQEKGLLSSIVKLLDRYTERSPLIVRLNYILGNMVACSDVIRLHLYEEPGAIEALLKVLDAYLKRSWPGEECDTVENIIIGSDLDGSSGSDEDVMVKTVRVLANMCMNSTVGSGLAMAVGGVGKRLLLWLLTCLRAHSPPSHPHLITSALATLNNITYYHTQQGGDGLAAFEIDLCQVLCRLLTMEVSPCVTEAIRVLGNMSRTQVTRDYIIDTGALMDITKLLNHDDEETCLAAAGVLVNMAAEGRGRTAWLGAGGARAAVLALQGAAARHRWPTALLLCQLLWNAAPLHDTDTCMLSPLLLNMLDEHQVFGNMDHYMMTHGPNGRQDEELISSHMAWEEFASVAVNLLEKIDPTVDSPLMEEQEFVFNNKNRTMSESDLTNM